MTPRQAESLRKRIQKLHTQQARAEKPLQNRLDKNGSAHSVKLERLYASYTKARDRLQKEADRKARPILTKLDAIEKKFEKRIAPLAGKLRQG